MEQLLSKTVRHRCRGTIEFPKAFKADSARPLNAMSGSNAGEPQREIPLTINVAYESCEVHHFHIGYHRKISDFVRWAPCAYMSTAAGF
jgi:hypothetical protein